jgi:hypothetical protein
MVHKTCWLCFLFLFLFHRFFYHCESLIVHVVLGSQEVLHELLALNHSKSANVNVMGTLPRHVARFATPIASEHRRLLWVASRAGGANGAFGKGERMGGLCGSPVTARACRGKQTNKPLAGGVVAWGGMTMQRVAVPWNMSLARRFQSSSCAASYQRLGCLLFGRSGPNSAILLWISRFRP